MIDGKAKDIEYARKGRNIMDVERQQIDVFLEKCDEVMRSKYIIADTKISELLRSIASSDLLYAFFREITKDFDYIAAQQQYMNYAPEGSMNKRKLLFPADPAEKLAFIFCLLVDFDNKVFDLGEFLQEYFYEDGSYYESFYAFSNQVIKPFQNLIKTMFRDSLLTKIAAADEQVYHREAFRCSDAVFDAILSEREQLFGGELSDDGKVDGLMILNALAVASQNDFKAYCGLLSGYCCFLSQTGFRTSDSEKLLREYQRVKNSEL